MDGLELATSQQLIEELMGRHTFAGLVLFSPEEQIHDDQHHSEFRLVTKTTAEDTLTILERAVKALKQGMH